LGCLSRFSSAQAFPGLLRFIHETSCRFSRRSAAFNGSIDSKTRFESQQAEVQIDQNSDDETASVEKKSAAGNNDKAMRTQATSNAGLLGVGDE
jgi:hypothetical protein